MKDHIPLYSSRITNTYVEYVSKFYPDIDIEEILQFAGINRYDIEDPGHWFTQRQVNLFHEKLVSVTRDPNISRKAGRYTTSAERIGAVKQYTLGLMSLTSVYLMMTKLSFIMTRGASASARKIGPNKVEIITKPKTGVLEKEFQCQNRIGTFESLAKLFTKNFAQVDHPCCFHRGDDHCKYNITWGMTTSSLLQRARDILSVASILLAIIFVFLTPLFLWIIFSLACSILILSLSFYKLHLENLGLKRTVANQGDAAEELIDEINTRHMNALLVQEIGQVTSHLLPRDLLLSKVLKVLSKHLDFKRGLIFQIAKNRRHLQYMNAYGYDQSDIDNISKLLIPVHSDNLTGPSIVNREDYLKSSIIDTSKGYGSADICGRQLGLESFIVIPIVYESESIGILILDTTGIDRQIYKSEINLLMGIAAQVAVSIISTRAFDEVREHKIALQALNDNLEEMVEERTAELKRAHEELENYNKVIKSLYKEVNHRTKNSFQIGSSILDMTINRTQNREVEEVLSETKSRIMTMALIHTQLCTSDHFDYIDVNKFIRELLEYQSQIYDDTQKINTRITGPALSLHVDQAIPCALAVNELILNAYKYAFVKKDGGHIEVSIIQDGEGNVSITVKDDGVGIPKDLDVFTTETLGLKLIRNLVILQLKGTLSIERENGTLIRIDFPVRIPKTIVI